MIYFLKYQIIFNFRRLSRAAKSQWGRPWQDWIQWALHIRKQRKNVKNSLKAFYPRLYSEVLNFSHNSDQLCKNNNNQLKIWIIWFLCDIYLCLLILRSLVGLSTLRACEGFNFQLFYPIEFLTLYWCFNNLLLFFTSGSLKSNIRLSHVFCKKIIWIIIFSEEKTFDQFEPAAIFRTCSCLGDS